MQAERIEVDIEGRTFFIETGILAKQAAGSVVVGLEETLLLCATSAEDKAKEGFDFLPLTVDYRDKTAAAGRIPGGFFKRESRPSDRETITSRLVDRSIRPMFADGYSNETQILINPLSFDFENDTESLAITSASASLMISHLPFTTPISGVRVGRIDGEFVIYPTIKEMETSDINLTVSGTEESLVMVEGGGAEMTEEDLVAALKFAHEWIKKLCVAQKELAAKIGKPKMDIPMAEEAPEAAEILAKVEGGLKAALLTKGKFERKNALKALRDEGVAQIMGESQDEVKKKALKNGFETIQKKFVRNMILEEGIRADGRKTDEIREITIAVDALPRTHGSCLFTRGETQALVTTTLGTSQDELTIDNLEGRAIRTFFLHYNFPGFCVGEVKRMMGASRREIGHGSLAERAIERVIPPSDKFPYTIRVVSEILESNGSSSMATVCGASLALMDAGAPIKAPVAGIAMGLVMEGERVAILSDILGMEDALGDMDFKVAGTRDGITAVQMDIKLEGGLDVELMKRALDQAKEGRLHILGIMDQAISKPREELNPNAPRIHTLKISPEKVRELIGPGGKVIKGIVADTGCQVDVNDAGEVKIFSSNVEKLNSAIGMVEYITQEAQLDKIYDGIVRRIVDFGAFVEIFPGTDGLLHISQIAEFRLENVEDVFSIGDRIPVKVIEVDPTGKVRLSYREAVAGTDKELREPPEGAGRGPARKPSGGGGPSRGGRDGRDGRDGRGPRR
ncbi:MAG: polyribonucleotide nucleotidyltransferase [Nitrospinota bacterium]|nr:polyribonucleotide nucleotidyltransferase [Nitrospinota bacterium]